MSTDSVYAKPEAPRIVLRPAAATVLVHGLILALMLWNGSRPQPSRTIEAKTVPKVVQARLVDASELAPEPKPAPQPRPQVKPRTQAKPAPQPQPKPAPVTPKPQPRVEPKPQPKPEPKPEPRITEEELAAIARADLARAVAEEQQAQAAAAAVTAAERAASYAALIRQTVVNYWSRPPSARNGMEAELEVRLVPTGEVISVRVVRGSGNSAFDRSAVNAVEKAGRFPELKDLPRNEFEANFRVFKLLFRPEDLRY